MGCRCCGHNTSTLAGRGVHVVVAGKLSACMHACLHANVSWGMPLFMCMHAWMGEYGCEGAKTTYRCCADTSPGRYDPPHHGLGRPGRPTVSGDAAHRQACATPCSRNVQAAHTLGTLERTRQSLERRNEQQLESLQAAVATERKRLAGIAKRHQSSRKEAVRDFASKMGARIKTIERSVSDFKKQSAALRVREPLLSGSLHAERSAPPHCAVISCLPFAGSGCRGKDG
eukprot:m.180138 g.180138  ORF g.180138 m.180138 type:complete len:229 (-) comp10463_c0_seq1:405-1091(-)